MCKNGGKLDGVELSCISISSNHRYQKVTEILEKCHSLEIFRDSMFSNLVAARGLATSCHRAGMMNFTKIQVNNKRGSKRFKKEQFKKWDKPRK